MKNRIDTVLGIIVMFLANFPVQCQVISHINWRPDEPVNGDSVTVSVIVRFGNRPFDETDTLRINENALEVDLFYEEPNEQMPTGNEVEEVIECGSLAAGNYTISVRLFMKWHLNNWEEYELWDHDSVEMVISDQVLRLATGWNLISAQFTPDDDNIVNLFAELVERGSLNFVKNQEGGFYLPGRWPGLEHWDSRQGYMVNMYRDDVLHILGERIAADEAIPLQAGWNMVAYLPTDPLPAPEAFHGIEDVLLIVKSGAGGFYVPSIPFNNMGSLQPGQGYMLRVSEQVDFIWNAP